MIMITEAMKAADDDKRSIEISSTYTQFLERSRTSKLTTTRTNRLRIY